MGHDDKKVAIKGLVGGTVAPMWKDIMLEAVKGLEVKDFIRPGGITSAQVCIDSGKAPSDLCSQDQRGSRVRTEMFIDGTEPVEICDVHTSAAVDIVTGKLASEQTPIERVKNKVFIIRKIKARSSLLDDPYVLPTEYSQYTPTVTPTPEDGTAQVMVLQKPHLPQLQR
jgi:penicillin-binding protein 1A